MKPAFKTIKVAGCMNSWGDIGNGKIESLGYKLKSLKKNDKNKKRYQD